MFKSLRFWESLYLARKRHLYESPQDRIQKIQIAVAGKLASYMDTFYFAAVIVKIIQKSTEKKEVVEAPPRTSSKSAHGPDGVLQSCYPDGYSTASSLASILSIPNLDSIFFPFPAPRCSPFLNPQSLPSNKASPGSQKTYWTVLKTLLNQSCHTELFLTQLKTALDHKTEKVKF